MAATQLSPGVWNINGYTVHFAGLAEAGEGTLSWEGWDFPVGGKIEGLTAQGANIYNAAVALIQQIPTSGPALLPGAALPAYPFATLYAYKVRPLSNGVTEFEVLFRAVGAPPGNVNFMRQTAAARQVETNRDVNGNLIQVSPTAGATASTDLTATDKKPQTKTVPAFRPQKRIEVVRQELGQNPTVDAETYEGSTNSGAVPWDRNAKPRTWMCMEITRESRDQGITWTATYIFEKGYVIQANPQVTTWDVVVAWINPQTGNAPDDLNPTVIAAADPTQANSAYQLAPTTDFSVFAFLFNFPV